MQLLSAIVVGVVAFASTNADNLLLMSSLRSTGAVGGRGLASGYLLGLAGVLVLTLLVGALSRLIPVHLVGFLGVAFLTSFLARDVDRVERELAETSSVLA